MGESWGLWWVEALTKRSRREGKKSHRERESEREERGSKREN